MIPPKRFDMFPPGWGCSEGLDAFRFFFKKCQVYVRAFSAHVPVTSLRFFVYFQVNTGLSYLLDCVEDIYDGW